ncbi:MAG: hypothetical protein BroJett025_02770 [Patescibacteria group bacterium]|nr:MAG: hypothetical protein BroJett025_02770 [Patescibacteria group bacterium]
MAQYQGPVRPGMDEAYFRQTGIERPIQSSTPQIKENGGWYWNSATGQAEQYWAPGQGPSSGGSSNSSNGGGVDDSLMREIDNIYSPSYSYLNQLESDAPKEYDSALKLVGEQYGLAKTNLQQGTDRNVAQLETNKQEAFDARRSALADAVRSYNALQQARIARFGGGSSAGEAATDIAQQEYYRGNADIEKAYTKQGMQIQTDIDDLKLQLQQNLSVLELQQKESEQSLRTEFNNKMSQIQMQKGQLDSAKAAARLNLMQQYATESRNIQLAFAQQANSIKDSIAASIAEKTGNFNELMKRAQAYDAAAYIGYANPLDSSTLNTKAQGTTAYNYNPNRYSDDEWANYLGI